MVFGIIGKALSHLGTIGKSLFGKFGHILGGIGKGKIHDMVPAVPDTVKGYEPNDPRAPWNAGKSMVERAKERYGGVHINPNSYHLPGLHNIH